MPDTIVMHEMTWTEVDAVLKDRPVALLPIGATEAHGPHLPLSTDTVIAQEMARRGAVKLKEHGVACLVVRIGEAGKREALWIAQAELPEVRERGLEVQPRARDVAEREPDRPQVHECDGLP